MDELPKKFSKEVRNRPHSAARTNEILGQDFEDDMDDDIASFYYGNIVNILKEQGLDIKKGIKVLEIGSGNAVFLNYLKKQGIDAVGVDARPRGGGVLLKYEHA